MFAIAEGMIKQAESLVQEVVEIDGKLAEALEAEVLLVTGNKAKNPTENSYAVVNV